MKKKLIEVALPLEAINKESAREKSIRQGHPSTLHLWWARRPLAACRAVLFASLVDDPASLPEQFPTEPDQDRERQRLFGLIERLVLWENASNQSVLDGAHAEILKSTGGNPPPIYDPFCGGGSIPLEAQRLGLAAYGSDLNPVAVLITKALIEIPPKHAGQPPVNPAANAKMSGKGMWTGARGLAEDVRYYGHWMRDRALERVGYLYPKTKLPKEHGGGEATVIAWLWARTIVCPNPACSARMPLVKSFVLSSRAGSKAWVEPIIDHVSKTIEFSVKTGDGAVSDSPKVGRGAKFRCLVCRETCPDQHVKDEGANGRMAMQMIAMVADGARKRVYLSPNREHILASEGAEPSWAPEQELANDPRNLWCIPYGLRRFRDLFTPRQLVALTAFSDLVAEARTQVLRDGGGEEYANDVSCYLALLVSRLTNTHSGLAVWSPTRDQSKNVFARQALPMVWDFAEVNPFANAAGDLGDTAENLAGAITHLPASVAGSVKQLDACCLAPEVKEPVFSTDPPYYDNIGYADLSDYFYVWLQRSLGSLKPELFSTLLVPKKQELVATPYRFQGSNDLAQKFFEEGFGKAFSQMSRVQNPAFPLTVYYAFKQSESDEDGENEGVTAQASTGWETMLEGLLRAGFQVTATWPLRSERSARSIAIGTNALASSIVLACRPRQASAPITTRKDFIGSLKKEPPQALRNLQKGNIAPVDLAQAAIGPGMAVFSKFAKVLETDGSPMRVRTALSLINQGLDEVLSELESEFDPDTRWALAWFEQHQFDEGLYGEAEVLATAKALSISHLAEAGILHSRSGKVRLLRRSELPEEWDPSTVVRLTVWEVTQHLIRRLDQKGEQETANLKAKIGGIAEIARDLAYRLYTLCERKGWAEEAGYYNSLVVAWPSMASEEFELR
jgi:putative DNA methylase